MSTLKFNPMVHQGRDDLYLVSELTVMRSAAGWYVGQYALSYYLDSRDDEKGTLMPYDRESGYFGNVEAAKAALNSLKESENTAGFLEENPRFLKVKKLWVEQNKKKEKPWEI